MEQLDLDNFPVDDAGIATLTEIDHTKELRLKGLNIIGLSVPWCSYYYIGLVKEGHQNTKTPRGIRPRHLPPLIPYTSIANPGKEDDPGIRMADIKPPFVCLFFDGLPPSDLTPPPDRMQRRIASDPAKI